MYLELTPLEIAQSKIKKLKARLAELESSSEPAGYGAWISIGNPPVLKADKHGFIRQRVMVFCEGDILLGFARKSYDGSVKFTADGRMGKWEITHWMPLPDAP